MLSTWLVTVVLTLIIWLRGCLSGFSAVKFLFCFFFPFHAVLFGRKSLSCLCQSHEGIFLGLLAWQPCGVLRSKAHKSMVLFRLHPLRLKLPRVSHFHSTPHSVSSNLCKKTHLSILTLLWLQWLLIQISRAWNGSDKFPSPLHIRAKTRDFCLKLSYMSSLIPFFTY